MQERRAMAICRRIQSHAEVERPTRGEATPGTRAQFARFLPTVTSKRMTLTIRRAAVVLLLLASSVAAHGQLTKFKFAPGPKAGGGEIRWSVAEKIGTIEVEKDEYAILEHEVKVFYQDIQLQADKVTLNLKTKDASAEGHVVVTQGPTRISADTAVFNLDSKTGTFFKATGTMDPSMYFSGDRIEKVDEDTYRLENGIFTSCDLDRPAWSFHVKSAEITLDDYAHMRGLSFRTKNVPIFWAPSLVWPTKRDRTKGFLIPRVMFSNRFGQRLELGYFLPFGESADATIYADLNTKQYWGTGATVRYVPSPNVKIGELTAYTVRDPEAKTQQWKYEYQHAQDNLPGGFRGVIDIRDFSDLDFFREYDRDPRLHTLSNIYSSAYLTKNRPGYSLNLLADRRDLLLGTERQRYEQLPSLQFRMYPQRIASSPLYFSMESSASHLRTSGLVRTGDADYQRADIYPTLALQLRTPPWFSVRPQISARQTYYSSSLSDPKLGQQTTLDESLDRFYAQGQVEVVGPSFSKIFNRSMGGFSKFKHVIEPRFRYLYTTNVDEQDRVLRFDTVDSPYLPLVRDSVEYSLTQRLIGKETGESGNAREVLSLSLRQTAALSKNFTTSSGSTLTTGQKFTPLVASLHANPYQSITVDASAAFGNISHQVDQASLSANLIGTGINSDKYLGLTWFTSFLQPGQTTGDSSQIRINTGSSLLKDRVRADVQLNFDAKEGTFLEQRYLLGGTGSCWGMALEYRRFIVYTPERKSDFSFGIAVTLKNVGSIGSK
jgi:LPS-assembly protein